MAASCHAFKLFTGAASLGDTPSADIRRETGAVGTCERIFALRLHFAEASYCHTLLLKQARDEARRHY